MDPFRIPCSAQQLKDLQAAVSVARDLATKAGGQLPPMNSTQGARFERWFGGSPGETDPVIKQVYGEIAVMLAFKKYWCLPPNSTTPESLFHTNAFVFKSNDWEIFVTSNFFALPVKGVATRAGTVIHEAGHQSSYRKIIDDDIDGDNKNDYGQKNAQLRAKKNASLARANADNFKYFAEDVVFGVP